MENATIRIAVVGAGGVGGYYAAMLSRAGIDVSVLARGAHLDAIQRDGLEVRGPDQDVTVQVRAGGDPKALARPFGERDFLIVAVKSFSLEQAAAAIAPFTEQGAAVLPLLNGVDVADRLVAVGVPRALILGGVTYLSAARIAPGIIVRRSPFARVIAGELNAPVSRRVQAAIGLFTAAGVDASASEDIQLELWRKFVMLSTMSAACAVLRSPIGGVRGSAAGADLISRGVHEAAEVARASGIPFTNEEESRVLAMIASFPAAMKPSLLLDLENGDPTEVDLLTGTVARLGVALGVDTPMHMAAVDRINAAARGTRGPASSGVAPS